MPQWLELTIGLAVWAFLQTWLLPRMGVPT
jgi:hypothetical protein